MYELTTSTDFYGTQLSVQFTQIWKTPTGHARCGGGFSVQQPDPHQTDGTWHQPGQVIFGTHPLRTITQERHQVDHRAVTQQPELPGPERVLQLIDQHLSALLSDHPGPQQQLRTITEQAHQTRAALNWHAPGITAAVLPDRREIRAVNNLCGPAAVIAITAHLPLLSPPSPALPFFHWAQRVVRLPLNPPLGVPFPVPSEHPTESQFVPVLNTLQLPDQREHAASLLELLGKPELAQTLRTPNAAQTARTAAYLHLAPQIGFAGVINNQTVTLSGPPAR